MRTPSRFPEVKTPQYWLGGLPGTPEHQFGAIEGLLYMGYTDPVMPNWARIFKEEFDEKFA